MVFFSKTYPNPSFSFYLTGNPNPSLILLDNILFLYNMMVTLNNSLSQKKKKSPKLGWLYRWIQDNYWLDKTVRSNVVLFWPKKRKECCTFKMTELALYMNTFYTREGGGLLCLRVQRCSLLVREEEQNRASMSV